MGDYLLLSWLCTRRGLTVFLLLLLLTAAGNLYRLASERANSNQPVAKTSSHWDAGNSSRGDRSGTNRSPHLRKPANPARPK
jgi:hypothetical protein